MKSRSQHTSARTLSGLTEHYPRQWCEVRRELLPLFEKRDIPGMERRLRAAKSTLAASPKGDAGIKARMMLLALEHFCLATITEKTSVRIKFNIFNGFILQRLLFAGGLNPKPISLFWFKLLWPFISQRNILMPLVQERGIYCFYSNRLIDELANLIGRRRCLEIAAGAGALTRFLKERGVNITATDDHSWGHQIKYPDCVEKIEARMALQQHQPEAVVCSWPPPGNRFERQIFLTSCVELYIMIGSRHSYASGDRDSCKNQRAFTMEHANHYADYVLPPELDSTVLIFRRKGR